MGTTVFTTKYWCCNCNHITIPYYASHALCETYNGSPCGGSKISRMTMYAIELAKRINRQPKIDAPPKYGVEHDKAWFASRNASAVSLDSKPQEKTFEDKCLEKTLVEKAFKEKSLGARTLGEEKVEERTSKEM